MPMLKTNFYEQACLVKVDGMLYKVNYVDIRYVEAIRNYIVIHGVEQKLIVHSSLKLIATYLPTERFCQVHKSYIIGLDYIKRFNHEVVCLNNDIELPISAKFFKILKDRFRVLSVCEESRIKSVLKEISTI